jgi:PAS domain-containing protein
VAEAVGRKCEDIFCEASYRCEKECPPKTAMREKRPILHREAETKTKTGDLRQTQISFSPFYRGDVCTGSVVVMKDVTDVKEAEERIRSQNEFLRLIIDSLPHPFYVIDASDYTIKIANKASMPSEPQKDVTCHMLTHHSDEPCGREGHPCPLDEVSRTRKPFVVEHSHYGPAGGCRSYEVHGFPILNQHGDVVQMIEYSMDISDRKEAEKRREQLISELEAALAQVKLLSGLLPICSFCKKIRDDSGYWNQIERYIREHSEAEFTHGICPDCMEKYYPEVKTDRSGTKKDSKP